MAAALMGNEGKKQKEGLLFPPRLRAAVL